MCNYQIFGSLKTDGKRKVMWNARQNSKISADKVNVRRDIKAQLFDSIRALESPKQRPMWESDLELLQFEEHSTAKEVR